MSKTVATNDMIVLGRAKQGVTLNGLEFLLDDKQEYRKFESKEEARAFIRAEMFPDSTDALQDDYFTFMTVEEAFEYEGIPENER